MRKLGTALTALALAVAGLAVPATTAHAHTSSTQGPNCDTQWRNHGRNGYMYAWENLDCTGTLLGHTEGDDPNWHDASGPFSGSDGDNATSVMNAGTLGGRDVVAFYKHADYDWRRGGYGCLSPREQYADNLTDNFFALGGNGAVINDEISSHRWANAGECGSGSWIT